MLNIHLESLNHIRSTAFSFIQTDSVHYTEKLYFLFIKKIQGQMPITVYKICLTLYVFQEIEYLFLID